MQLDFLSVCYWWDMIIIVTAILLVVLTGAKALGGAAPLGQAILLARVADAASHQPLGSIRPVGKGSNSRVCVAI
jgi:hypothetical protein